MKNRQNKAKNNLSDLRKSVISPLSKKGLRKEVHAEANLQYTPQRRQLQAEQRASALQAFRLKKYFKQYGHSIGGTQRQTKKAYNQAGSQMDATNAALGAYSRALGQDLASQGQASAASRGVGYVPDTSSAQAAVSRYGAGNTLSGVLRTQGASQRGYLADQKRIGKREMIDALQQEAARGRSYNQDLENLARERGQAATQARQQNTAANRDFYLGLLSAHNTRANAILAAKTSAANSRRTAASSAASTQVALGNLRARLKEGKISHKQFKQEQHRLKHEYNKSHTKGGKSKGTVPSSSSSGPDPDNVRKGLAALRSSPAKVQKVLAGDRKRAIDTLVSQASISPAEARQAYKRWKQGLSIKGQIPKPVSGLPFG